MTIEELLVSKRITCEDAEYPQCESLFDSIQEYEDITGDTETFRNID